MEENFSGKVLVRMPVALHQRLSYLAKQHEVSLNQYIIFLLSINESRASFERYQNDDIERQFKKTKEELNMGQNKESGRLGNEVGRLIGREIAEHLGIITEPGSNKAVYKGRNVVIKSARLRNTQFGITNRMAGEIEDVILAKEVQEGVFDLYIVDFDKIKDTGRPSKSKKNIGKVTNFSILESLKYGIKFDRLVIALPL